MLYVTLTIFRLNDIINPEFGRRIMNGFMTAQEAADKWGITVRQVQLLCKSNRIEGASMLSRIWLIPEDAEKPADLRRRASKYEDR